MKVFTALLCLFSVSSLQASTWHSEIAPYLWASSLNGTVQIAQTRVTVHEPFIDLLKKDLKFGAMLWAASYNDLFGVFFNGLYTKVSNTQYRDNIRITTTGQMVIAAAGLSHRMYFKDRNSHYLEPYVGVRFTDNVTKLAIDFLDTRQKEDWADAILGARINFIITPNFNLEAAADYGRGSESNSYNGSVLAGYQSPKYFKNTRFYLGYRFLHQNYTHGYDIHFYQWDMDIAGPVAGLLFKF